MKKIALFILIFLFSVSNNAQNKTNKNISDKYSLSPTAFTLDKGGFDFSLHGPFLNHTFFNIRNNYVNGSGFITEYYPSNFYSVSYGITDFLTTTVGVSPLLMVYSGFYRYLPIYNNTKVGFEVMKNVHIGGGLFSFNLPNEIRSANYKVENYWEFLPNPNIDSSYVIVPYLTLTIGNQNNSLTFNYSTNRMSIVSGKVKISDSFFISSENFFINWVEPKTTRVHINNISVGYLPVNSWRINLGAMYLSQFKSQDRTPIMPQYSINFRF